MPEPIHPPKLYLFNYVALMVLLVLTVSVSFIDLGRYWNNGIAVAIACTKALLIVMIFMHVRFQPWVTWLFAGAGFLWLGIMFTLSIAEYVGRNHPPDVNPKGEPVFVSTEPYPSR